MKLNSVRAPLTNTGSISTWSAVPFYYRMRVLNEVEDRVDSVVRWQLHGVIRNQLREA